MATVLVEVNLGVLPAGFCPRGESALQEIYDKFFEITQFSLSADKAFYNFGNVIPTPENRVFPWFRTVGGYPDRWYIYAGGSWIAKHPLLPGFTTIAPSTIVTPTDLDTYDEGSAGAVTLVTGPFWEVDTAFAGRSPMGVGAIPSANPAHTLIANETYGEGAHLQTGAEVGAHTHEPSPKSIVSSGSGSTVGLLLGGSGNPEPDLAILANTAPAAMPVIHPVLARYIIKRTARQYYVVP